MLFDNKLTELNLFCLDLEDLNLNSSDQINNYFKSFNVEKQIENGFLYEELNNEILVFPRINEGSRNSSTLINNEIVPFAPFVDLNIFTLTSYYFLEQLQFLKSHSSTTNPGGGPRLSEETETSSNVSGNNIGGQRGRLSRGLGGSGDGEDPGRPQSTREHTLEMSQMEIEELLALLTVISQTTLVSQLNLRQVRGLVVHSQKPDSVIYIETQNVRGQKTLLRLTAKQPNNEIKRLIYKRKGLDDYFLETNPRQTEKYNQFFEKKHSDISSLSRSSFLPESSQGSLRSISSSRHSRSRSHIPSSINENRRLPSSQNLPYYQTQLPTIPTPPAGPSQPSSSPAINVDVNQEQSQNQKQSQDSIKINSNSWHDLLLGGAFSIGAGVLMPRITETLQKPIKTRKEKSLREEGYARGRQDFRDKIVKEHSKSKHGFKINSGLKIPEGPNIAPPNYPNLDREATPAFNDAKKVGYQQEKIKYERMYPETSLPNSITKGYEDDAPGSSTAPGTNQFLVMLGFSLLQFIFRDRFKVKNLGKIGKKK